ncbi:MAG: hypothetical protein IKQ75_07885 [Bacteroidales bacterium]|nr:hypothetical protein [Bacteroidales bacterium]
MTLYVFNPEHDYALANNDPHFVAPASAIRFADECATVLRHIVEDEGILFLPYQEKHFLSFATMEASRELPTGIDRVCPWGWDHAIALQLQEAGVPEQLLPSREDLESLRTLAHRQTAAKAMRYLHQQMGNKLPLPPSAELLTTPEDAERYIRQWQDVIFKSPYSGNGRGHLYAHGSSSPTLRRQISGVIRRQGAIMAEPLLNVVQDFAMEFRCQGQKVHFCGYSLFNTMHYGYAGNLLWTDEAIEQHLSQWIAVEQLLEIREAILHFLGDEIAPHYQGYLGVDMFIYQDNGFKINPMVEINLRMTMGMASHIIRERYLHPDTIGTFKLEYRPKPGDLLQYADQLNRQHPFEEHDGQWYSGFRSLTPVTKTTQYAFFVLLESR